jgi:hypothetical protein
MPDFRANVSATLAHVIGGGDAAPLAAGTAKVERAAACFTRGSARLVVCFLEGTDRAWQDG